MTFALLLALLVLALLVAAVVRSVRTSSLAALVGCVVLAGIWLVANKPLEGPLLLRLGGGHGVTLGDVLSPVAVLVAALATLQRSPAPDDREPAQAGRGSTRAGR